MAELTPEALQMIRNHCQEHAKQPNADGYYVHTFTDPFAQMVCDELKRQNLAVEVEWKPDKDGIEFSVSLVPKKGAEPMTEADGIKERLSNAIIAVRRDGSKGVLLAVTNIMGAEGLNKPRVYYDIVSGHMVPSQANDFVQFIRPGDDCEVKNDTGLWMKAVYAGFTGGEKFMFTTKNSEAYLGPFSHYPYIRPFGDASRPLYD